MARDERFDVHYFPVRDMRPWESARNVTIHAARSIGADWLVSFDNDNFVPDGNPLDIIATAGDKRVIGLTYGSGAGAAKYHLFPYQNHGATDGPFREEECVGGGVLMIHKTVWQTTKGPWFRWQHSENELLSPDERTCGEDVYFCRLVRQHGIKVWTHLQQFAGHYRTADVTGMVCTLAQSAAPLVPFTGVAL